MRRLLVVAIVALALNACASTQRRAMNDGERTLTTGTVRALVQSQGEVDVRFDERIRCERIRIVGTHLIQRFCYSGADAKEAARDAMRRYSRSVTVGGCGAGGCSGGGPRAAEGGSGGGNIR